jgi:hypothetical protein
MPTHPVLHGPFQLASESFRAFASTHANALVQMPAAKTLGTVQSICDRFFHRQMMMKATP